MLLNTAAGGVGLNLQGDKDLGTGPTAMYILNEPWRDIDTRQVIDRISRQGQQFPTTSWIARQKGTIEDKVHTITAAKGLVGSYLSHGETGVARDLQETLQKRLTLQDQFKLLNLQPEMQAKLMALVERQRLEANTRKATEKPAATKRVTVRRTPQRKNAWD